jgi:hypothetical protein
MKQYVRRESRAKNTPPIVTPAPIYIFFVFAVLLVSEVGVDVEGAVS